MLHNLFCKAFFAFMSLPFMSLKCILEFIYSVVMYHNFINMYFMGR